MKDDRASAEPSATYKARGVEVGLKDTSRPDMEEVYIRWLREGASRPAAGDEELRARAWEVARSAARLLRHRYAVSRVRVFGSLVHAGRFCPGSDIDLAVEGLRPSDYWEAMTALLFLDDRVPVALVDRAGCRPEIWRVIEQEGKDP